MSRSWVEKFAVFAMALGLLALAAVSVAALLIAAGVFICLAAILYIINPAGVRAALKVLADKPDEWLKRAHDWLESFKEILATFQAAAQAAASAPQAEMKCRSKLHRRRKHRRHRNPSRTDPINLNKK